MKIKSIIFTAFMVFLLSGISAVILQSHFTKQPENNETKPDFPDSATAESATTAPYEETEDVLSENPETEKYTLHLELKSGKVLLTTQFKDGSQLISHIKSINPEFLEPKDIDALTFGIELYNKEDMLMLIEDYSN